MQPDPQILRSFESIQWIYAMGDNRAYEELRSRIAEYGRNRRLLDYSTLVAGTEFRLPSLSAQPYMIDVHAWTDLDGAIVGDFLGRACMDSYRDHGFMVSALVISKNGENPEPAKGFFDLMRKVGALQSRDRFAQTAFWSGQVTLAHEYYARTTDATSRTHK